MNEYKIDEILAERIKHMIDDVKAKCSYYKIPYRYADERKVAKLILNRIVADICLDLSYDDEVMYRTLDLVDRYYPKLGNQLLKAFRHQPNEVWQTLEEIMNHISTDIAEMPARIKKNRQEIHESVNQSLREMGFNIND